LILFQYIPKLYSDLHNKDLKLLEAYLGKEKLEFKSSKSTISVKINERLIDFLKKNISKTLAHKKSLSQR
jgi:hypothetical protein